MSMKRWINKMRSIHTIEYCLKKEILTHATTRMHLENMLSKINQTQKDKYHEIPFICATQNSQVYRESRKEVSGNWGGGVGSYYLMGTPFLFGKMKFLEISRQW